MKLLLSLTILALACIHVKSEMNEDMNKIIQQCQQENHIGKDELGQYFQGAMKPNETPEPLKCHMKCVMEKQGHLKNGVFDDQAALKFLKELPALKDHQDVIENAIRECKEEKGANDCDTAYKITTCFSQHKANIGL